MEVTGIEGLRSQPLVQERYIKVALANSDEVSFLQKPAGTLERSTRFEIFELKQQRVEAFLSKEAFSKFL